MGEPSLIPSSTCFLLSSPHFSFPALPSPKFAFFQGLVKQQCDFDNWVLFLSPLLPPGFTSVFPVV